MDKLSSGTKKIDYFGILKKAWRITWNNKYLWWFGFFVALGGGGFHFNFSLDDKDIEKLVGSEQNIQENLSSFLTQYAGWIILAIGAVLILVVLFLVLRIIGQAGIIKSTDDIEKNRKNNFKDGFQSGKKYFWKIFLMGLLIGIFTLGVLVILSLPIVYLFYLEAYPIAFLSLFLAIIIFIPLVILASFIRIYGGIYVVLGKLRVISSIENAYKLFRKNIFSSIIMSLILTAIGLAVGISTVVAFLPLLIVLIPLGLILYFLLNKIGVIIVAVIGILIFISIALFAQSVYEVYRQVIWVLFFKKIAGENKRIENKIKNEVLGKKIIEPERV